MVISFTNRAKEQLIYLLQSKNQTAIKINIETKGCSGKAYTMTYSKSKDPLDEEISLDPTHSLYIDPKAMLFIIGTEIDYETSHLQSGFIFNNPNEKGRCGCGKSFHV